MQHDQGDAVTDLSYTRDFVRDLKDERDALLAENDQLRVELDAAQKRYLRAERILYPQSHEQADILERACEALAGDADD